MPGLKTYFNYNWVRAIFLLLVLVLLWQLEDFPIAVEKYYTGTFYKGISRLQHLLFSWVPFSFGDWVYIIFILGMFFAILYFLKILIQGRFRLFAFQALRIIITIEFTFLIFYIFWGINYFRPPASEVLKLTDTTYSINDVKSVTRMIIDSANNSRANIVLADLTQSEDTLHATAVRAVKKLSALSPKFSVFMPAVKSSMLSSLLNYMGTSGYYNPFTGEAQINKLMPVFDKPFTACHEMAHQIGFAHEDEANFVGYLAGIRSKDRLLKYSAYYEATIEFLHYMHRRDTIGHKELKALLSKGIIEDLKADSAYWTKYEGVLGNVSGKFYDSFLKANKQPAGLKTYNRMIILTMAWYKRQEIY